jgi:TDG/mug DNA glycosylase family protein
MKWMGQDIETLEDLWPADARAMVIGINPAPVSVSIGHYYQGPLGQTLFRRLRAAGILQNSSGNYEDDQAVKAGVGFTDVVKRSTPRADEIERNELLYGRVILEEKLAARPVPLVIFAFKKSATTLLGRFKGNGLLSGRPLAGSEVFVMPGPYESSATANPTLDSLKSYWRAGR